MLLLSRALKPQGGKVFLGHPWFCFQSSVQSNYCNLNGSNNSKMINTEMLWMCFLKSLNSACIIDKQTLHTYTVLLRFPCRSQVLQFVILHARASCDSWTAAPKWMLHKCLIFTDGPVSYCDYSRTFCSWGNLLH